MRPRAGADHRARQRHRQLRPVRAAARRRDPRHERPTTGCCGCSPAWAARRPASGWATWTGRCASRRARAALRADHLPQRHAWRLVRRRLRRRRLDQLRAARRARQRARRARDHVEAQPRVVELRGPEALLLHHVCGTNGMVLELEVGSGTGAPMAGGIVCFDAFDAGAGVRRCRGRRPRRRQEGVALFWRSRSPICCCRRCTRWPSSLPAGLPRGLHAGGRVRRGRAAASWCCSTAAASPTQDRRRGAEGATHAAGVHLEPHHAARDEGRQVAHLHCRARSRPAATRSRLRRCARTSATRCRCTWSGSATSKARSPATGLQLIRYTGEERLAARSCRPTARTA